MFVRAKGPTLWLGYLWCSTMADSGFNLKHWTSIDCTTVCQIWIYNLKYFWVFWHRKNGLLSLLMIFMSKKAQNVRTVNARKLKILANCKFKIARTVAESMLLWHLLFYFFCVQISYWCCTFFVISPTTLFMNTPAAFVDGLTQRSLKFEENW